MTKIRDMVVGPDKAKDSRDTKVLDGQAEKTPAQSDKNVTHQYTTSGGGASKMAGAEASYDN